MKDINYQEEFPVRTKDFYIRETRTGLILIESSADARSVSRIEIHATVELPPRVEVIYLSELFGFFVAIWLTDTYDSCTMHRE